MRKEKRKNARASVHTHATVDYANVEQEKATLIDLAQDGMAVRFGKKLPPTSKVYFQFQLPGQSASVRLSGQVVWQDWNGRAGVQFVDVPKASRRLVDGFPKREPTDRDRLSESELQDVTVEMEGPVQHMSIPLETPRAKKPATSARLRRRRCAVLRISGERTRIERAPEKGRAADEDRHGERSVQRPETHTDDRRTQNRYACRIGAEVYRTGTIVPNHCNLTDLSSGGCYWKCRCRSNGAHRWRSWCAPHDMKVRLRGAVHASHPGYGMGIAFELKTKEERDSVKTLLEFVAETVGTLLAGPSASLSGLNRTLPLTCCVFV